MNYKTEIVLTLNKNNQSISSDELKKFLKEEATDIDLGEYASDVVESVSVDWDSIEEIPENKQDKILALQKQIQKINEEIFELIKDTERMPVLKSSNKPTPKFDPDDPFASYFLK